MDPILSIKLRDIEIFLEVSRAKSIREVGRRLSLTPGQVSKCIQQLESKLGTKLYKRSVSGVLPTTQGNEVLEIAREIALSGEKMKQLLSSQGKTTLIKSVALASTSFLNTHLVTPAACRFSSNKENLNFLDSWTWRRINWCPSLFAEDSRRPYIMAGSPGPRPGPRIKSGNQVGYYAQDSSTPFQSGQISGKFWNTLL